MNSPKSKEQNREEKTVKNKDLLFTLTHSVLHRNKAGIGQPSPLLSSLSGRVHKGPMVSACVRNDPRQKIHEMFSERCFFGGTCGSGSAALDGADASRGLTVMNGEGHSMSGRHQRGGGAPARRPCTPMNPQMVGHIWLHRSAGSTVTAPISHLIFTVLAFPSKGRKGQTGGSR